MQQLRWRSCLQGRTLLRRVTAHVTVVDEAGKDRQTTYHYDPSGNRVKKLVGGNQTSIYVYDAFGKLAAEYKDSGTPTPGTFYRTVDHLGSTRLVTDGLGTEVENTDYLPFGEEILVSSGDTRFGIAAYGSSGLLHHKFTGKERDTESGMDYFLARYYSGPMGRFLSPDKPFLDQSPKDPQSWNLYVYVRNNSVVLIDPTGGQAVIGTTRRTQPATVTVLRTRSFKEFRNSSIFMALSARRGPRAGPVTRNQVDRGAGPFPGAINDDALLPPTVGNFSTQDRFKAVFVSFSAEPKAADGEGAQLALGPTVLAPKKGIETRPGGLQPNESTVTLGEFLGTLTEGQLDAVRTAANELENEELRQAIIDRVNVLLQGCADESSCEE